MGGIQHGGKFDMLVYGWYAGIDPDNSSQLTCDNFPPHGYNDMRYCSAAMDAAQSVALSHYDRPTRKAAYAEIERLLSVDNPALYFWWQRQQEAISRRLPWLRSQPGGRIVERLAVEHMTR